MSWLSEDKSIFIISHIPVHLLQILSEAHVTPTHLFLYIIV